MLLFETTAPSEPNLGQLSHFLTLPLPVNIRDGWMKCLSQNEGQSSTIQVDVSDFRHVAIKPECAKGEWAKFRIFEHCKI